MIEVRAERPQQPRLRSASPGERVQRNLNSCCHLMMAAAEVFALDGPAMADSCWAAARSCSFCASRIHSQKFHARTRRRIDVVLASNECEVSSAPACNCNSDVRFG